MIVNLRVDHRLLHGQVAFSWIKYTGANCVLIANDAVASDVLRMSALRLAKPEGVKLVMKSVDDSIAAIKSGVTDKYALFVITESVKDADRMIEGLAGTERALTELSLGGVKVADGKKRISKAVFLSDAECDAVRRIAGTGVRVTVQMVPSEPAEDALKLIDSAVA